MSDLDFGWRYGPDGSWEPGFLEGTAFQPLDLPDHMDAWGTPHPGNLASCVPCSASADLTQGGAA
ncbi:hypothetical protein [Streptomyces rubiginosohelvolus]|uniref:hypothetical protein n=1 Tax=Streptomyces rubiginosohelvolus TaxID=67362 RepID=UPI0037FA4FD0